VGSGVPFRCRFISSYVRRRHIDTPFHFRFTLVFDIFSFRRLYFHITLFSRHCYDIIAIDTPLHLATATPPLPAFEAAFARGRQLPFATTQLIAAIAFH
jgi:hypothetical protein